MSLNENNKRILGSLREAVAGLVAEELDLDQIQSSLQAALGLLENDGTGIIKAVRIAEADVEEIRFTRLGDEQRSAIIFRLDELLEVVENY